MRVERLEEGLALASDCPAPDRSAALCEELSSWGVASLLEVGDFIDPIAQRVHASLWCFKSPLNELDAVSPLEVQVIRDFVGYELAQTRSVALWAGNDAVRDAVVSEAVAEARRDTSNRPRKRLLERRRCCASYNASGCDPTLVCHAAPLSVAQEIVVTGAILSRSVLTAAPPEAVARTSSWGEPADYFEYVMLANGNCVAPDAVAASRQSGRDLVPDDLRDGWHPGVRFFFDPGRLAEHPRAAWDGVHTIKVRDGLELEPYLVAVVVPSATLDGSRFSLDAPGWMRDKVSYLDPGKYHHLSEWSAEALKQALSLRTSSKR